MRIFDSVLLFTVRSHETLAVDLLRNGNQNDMMEFFGGTSVPYHAPV
jgi:hypothetical protein